MKERTIKSPTSVYEFKISAKKKTGIVIESGILNTSYQLAEYCRKIFDADTIEWVESFIVIALNRNMKVTGFYKVSQGGITGTVVDPRVIMQFALLSNASGLILCHNHPSGNLRSSNADDNITTKLVKAGELLDIRIFDHIILGESGYYSYLDEGKI